MTSPFRALHTRIPHTEWERSIGPRIKPESSGETCRHTLQRNVNPESCSQCSIDARFVTRVDAAPEVFGGQSDTAGRRLLPKGRK